MFPLDFLGVLEDPSLENVAAQFWQQRVRDSLMANEFIERYEEGKSSRRKGKALIIMNSRHAFKRDIIGEDGSDIENMARFICEKYPGVTATVLINNWSLGYGEDYFGLMQDGKWDAAFQYLNMEDAGFDIEGTPFGNDRLDYGKWMLRHNDLKYQDVFDGFVFYYPVGKYLIGQGVDGLMDDGFYDEYIERTKRVNAALKRDIYPVMPKERAMILNEQKITPINNLEKLQRDIDKWLK